MTERWSCARYGKFCTYPSCINGDKPTGASRLLSWVRAPDLTGDDLEGKKYWYWHIGMDHQVGRKDYGMALRQDGRLFLTGRTLASTEDETERLFQEKEFRTRWELNRTDDYGTWTCDFHNYGTPTVPSEPYAQMSEAATGPRSRAADSFDVIEKNLWRIKRKCYKRHDRPTSECWCIGTGDNGGNAPCPTAEEES